MSRASGVPNDPLAALEWLRSAEVSPCAAGARACGAVYEWLVEQTSGYRPAEAAWAYLPDPDELRTSMGSRSSAQRAQLIGWLHERVVGRWRSADQLGLIERLDRVRAQEAAMATSGVNSIAGIENAAPRYYREYLMTDAGGRAGTITGRRLVLSETPATDIAQVALGADDSADAIMHLRRLDDVLCRAMIGHAVAAQTGASIEGVMALYRVEGDMAVPPSRESIEQGIPSGRQDAVSSISPPQEISHLVWLADPGAFEGATEARIRDFALRVWFVQIAGLDVVGGMSRLPDEFGDWSYDNRRVLGVVDTTGNARQRWTSLAALLGLQQLTSASGMSAALAAQVSSPEVLVQGVLTEGVFLLQRYERVESLLSLPDGHALLGTRLSSGMAYLHYNLGLDGLQRMLASAVFHAARTTAATWSALRSAIAADQKLSSAIASDLDPGALWGPVERWLTADERLGAQRLDLLTVFVETAGGDVWGSWDEPRGNLSRFLLLREYYRRVFA